MNTKKNRKNKPLILTMAVTLALVTILSATFAWFTSKDAVTNHLETARLTDGDVNILEVWNPEDGENWTPDTEVNKDVGAINTGSADAFVRISFEEVLNKLVDGTPLNMTAPWSATQKGLDLTASGGANYSTYDVIPQLVNTDAYAGWTKLTTSDATFTNAASLTIPAGVTVMYKTTTVGTKTTYNFAAYYALADGTYQKIDMPTVDVVYTPGANPPTTATNVLTLGTIQYQALAVSPEVKADWLTTKHAAADIASSSVGKPATARTNTWALTDATNKYIKLIFTDNVKTTLADCNTGDWYYDVTSGWFYYIGVLGSGEATSSYLLDALYLSDAANSSYSNMSFDLTVKMEAIQATADALSSTSGWKLSVTTDSALIAKLVSFL